MRAAQFLNSFPGKGGNHHGHTIRMGLLYGGYNRTWGAFGVYRDGVTPGVYSGCYVFVVVSQAEV